MEFQIILHELKTRESTIQVVWLHVSKNAQTFLKDVVLGIDVIETKEDSH